MDFRLLYRKISTFAKRYRESILWDISLIVLGMVMTLVLMPSLSGIVVDAEVEGYDPIEEPKLTADIRKTDASTSQGNSVPGFGQIRWEKGFELYHLRFRNEGPRSVTLKANIEFPGCVVGYRKQKQSERTYVEREAASYIHRGNASWRITRCEQVIRVEDLPAEETATLTVLVKRLGSGYIGADSEVALFDLNVNRTVNVGYHWNYYGRHEESTQTSVLNANSSYIDAHLAIADHYYDQKDSEGMAFQMRKAYRINSTNVTILKRYGFSLASYGYESKNKKPVRAGLSHIKRALEKQPNDASAWYYRAVAHTNLMLLSEEEREIAENYCLAIASLNRATNESADLRAAYDLEEKLRTNNPGVNCTIKVVDS